MLQTSRCGLGGRVSTLNTPSKSSSCRRRNRSISSEFILQSRIPRFCRGQSLSRSQILRMLQRSPSVEAPAQISVPSARYPDATERNGRLPPWLCQRLYVLLLLLLLMMYFPSASGSGRVGLVSCL